jgi:hypothetical protein
METKLVVIVGILFLIVYYLLKRNTESFTVSENDAKMVNGLVTYLKTKPGYIDYLNYLNNNGNTHPILIRKDIFKNLLETSNLTAENVYSFL